MFRAMDVGRFLCSAGALGSPALLPSFSIITISLHISIILIITHLQSFYTYISIHLYNYNDTMVTGTYQKGDCCHSLSSPAWMECCRKVNTAISRLTSPRRGMAVVQVCLCLSLSLRSGPDSGPYLSLSMS